MHTQKIDDQKQKTGSIDYYSGKVTLSQQFSKKGFCFQPDHQMPASGVVNLGNSTANMSNTSAGHFCSPAASAFYATEVYMGFAEFDSHPVDSSPSIFDPPCSHSRDTQNISSRLEKPPRSRTTPLQNLPACDLLYVKSEVEVEQPYRILQEKQNQTIPYELVETSPRFQPRRQPTDPSHTTTTTCVGSNKRRIKWTHDLHKQFVKSVNRLGGAEKATPKGILRLMESEGITIFQIKSHLQKYRLARHIPGSTEEPCEKGTCANVLPNFDPEIGLRIAEALKLQLNVQRRLHEQLQIQRNLQMQIEEQGKQLKKMLDITDITQIIR